MRSRWRTTRSCTLGASARAARSRTCGRASQIERLDAEVALLREELRIKDVRLGRIAPAKRPLFPPEERMAILQLKAARAWSAEQAARRFLLTAVTIAARSARLEADPTGLLQLSSPVNRFPALVAGVVAALKRVAPAMGKVRIAQMLARSGCTSACRR